MENFHCMPDGEQPNKIENKFSVEKESAISFFNWLCENGYCFSDKPHRVYLGGKYYWIQDVYDKYEKETATQSEGTTEAAEGANRTKKDGDYTFQFYGDWPSAI